MPIRIPFEYLVKKTSKKDLILIILRQFYYYSFYAQKEKKAYKIAWYSIWKLSTQELNEHIKKKSLVKLRGVGNSINRLIEQIFNEDYENIKTNLEYYFT